MAPAFALLAAHIDPVRALILSQVALAAGLPFALGPLVLLTSRPDVMGALVNRRITTAAAIVITVGIVGLNGVLLWQAASG